MLSAKEKRELYMKVYNGRQQEVTVETEKGKTVKEISLKSKENNKKYIEV